MVAHTTNKCARANLHSPSLMAPCFERLFVAPFQDGRPWYGIEWRTEGLCLSATVFALELGRLSTASSATSSMNIQDDIAPDVQVVGHCSGST